MALGSVSRPPSFGIVHIPRQEYMMMGSVGGIPFIAGSQSNLSGGIGLSFFLAFV
jgi:hypothetical protein